MSECRGQLFCCKRRWPITVSFGPTVMRVRYDRLPSPTDPHDQILRGTVTVAPADEGDLPTDVDLLSRPLILLLLETLPVYGKCPLGEWQLSVAVSNIRRDHAGKTVTFDFMQDGGVGRTLA